METGNRGDGWKEVIKEIIRILIELILEILKDGWPF